MAKARVKVHDAGRRWINTQPGTRALLGDKAAAVAAAARASAPVESGAYRDSITVTEGTHPTMAYARVVAGVPYAAEVEADTGTLGRALDAAGGSRGGA